MSLVEPGGVARPRRGDRARRDGRASQGVRGADRGLAPLPPAGRGDGGPAIVPPGESEAVLRLFARPDADPVFLAAGRRGPAGPAPPGPPRDDPGPDDAIDPTSGRRRGGGRASGRGAAPGRLAVRPDRAVAVERSPAASTPAAAEQGKTVDGGLHPRARPRRSPARWWRRSKDSRRGRRPSRSRSPPGLRRVEFRVTVAATTPVGEHDTLVCRLTGKVGGQDVVYRVGRGGMLKVVPPGCPDDRRRRQAAQPARRPRAARSARGRTAKQDA